MINKYVWELYLKSGGDKTVNMFRNALSSSSGLTEDYVQKIAHLHEYYCASTSIVDTVKEQLLFLLSALENNDEVDRYVPDRIKPDEEKDEYMDRIFTEEYEAWKEESGSDKNAFCFFNYNLANISTYLSICYPEFFVPYYFFANYNILSKIADTFDIPLIQIPKKSDYRGRTFHYVNICKRLYHFRKSNNLTNFELYAFLYDFAPKYVGGIDSYIIRDLPEPKAAYFIGGGGDNEDATAEDYYDEISFWQCNPDTRAGDMIVMYLRTPISSISSIWRSQSVGFVDPFFYYYRCTYIGGPKKITRIPIQSIKSDPVLGKMPIVLKNMQGINGVELKPSDYNYIVTQSGANVPKLEYSEIGHNGMFVNEKQVEEELIKPLLKLLGYEEADYERQMYIEIGNHNHALIPDFVLLPDRTGGHYSGTIIVEAKRSIKNEKQLEDAKLQVRSYAKLLGARYTVIASMEKVWVTSYKDDFSEHIYDYTWEDLSNDDVFFSLEKEIGKRRFVI